MPLADYCDKTLKYKRMAVIADDIAYGHEMCAGFQRVFEELGGKVVQKHVPAAHRARLRHLSRAAEDQRRRDLPRLRRLERLPLSCGSSTSTG